ncbi:MAG: protein kinase [Verrucomicrobiota bacterium]
MELIGSGGMGTVYKARQPHLDRFVALKVLPQSLAELPAFTDRFTREGRLLAKLSHPNIVGVYDFGETDGLFFLLMEYVDGVNLREAMRAGKFSPEQALKVVPEICEALQFAHETGILHRDIKPENILLDTQGRIKIVDFGIAKLIGEAAGLDPTLTGSRTPGTPSYMAPEQIEQTADVDHRADIYSLGVVFYEMLTGELPLGRFAPPSEKTKVGADVDSIVLRTLEKEPDRRQQSADELKTQVEDLPPATTTATLPSVGASASEDSPTAEPATPAPRPSGAGKAVLLLLASFALLIVSALGIWITSLNSISRQMEARVMDDTVAALHEEADALDQINQSAAAPNEPEAVTAREEAAQIRQKIQSIEEDRSSQFGPPNNATPIIYRVALIATIPALIVLVLALVATIMGWIALRRLRLSGQHQGRIPAVFAGLFLPLLIINALLIVVTGLILGTLLIVAIDALIIWLVWRWLNTPPSDTEKAESAHNTSTSSNSWIIWLVLALVCIPILLIGGCAVMFFSLTMDSQTEALNTSPAEGHGEAHKITPLSNEPTHPESEPPAGEPQQSPPAATDPFGAPPPSNLKPKPDRKSNTPPPPANDPFGSIPPPPSPHFLVASQCPPLAPPLPSPRGKG